MRIFKANLVGLTITGEMINLTFNGVLIYSIPINVRRQKVFYTIVRLSQYK